MITANFELKRSNIGTYLKTYVYLTSLFNFLNDYNMIKEKYKNLVTPHIDRQLSSLFVPVKLANKMPFILAALSCKRLIDCLFKADNLKLVKSRAKNYYCEDLLTKLVSVFGNKKAWDEFGITSEWKPKLKFVEKVEFRWPHLFVPYFNFMCYGVTNQSATKYKSIFGVSVCWANTKILKIERASLLNKLNNISKRRISRTLNNPSKKAVKDFRNIIEVMDVNKDLLSKDGIELQKDLTLARTLV